MARLRAECAKYLSALTSDNAYALYRDAVDIVARFSGEKFSHVSSGDEGITGPTHTSGPDTHVHAP